MSNSFSTRQANGINAFFERIGVPEDKRDVRRLRLIDSYVGRGSCEVCGHSPIKYHFVLTDEDRGGRLVAGSDCITTYMSANGALSSVISGELKKLKREATRNSQNEKRKVAREALEHLRSKAEETGALGNNEFVDKWIGVLQEIVDRNWTISDKQLVVARKAWLAAANHGFVCWPIR